jgi:hypothetical protein
MEQRVHISALVPRSLADSLKAAADANQGSLASEIRRRLAQDFEVQRAVAPPVERAQPIPADSPDGPKVDVGGAQRNGHSKEGES